MGIWLASLFFMSQLTNLKKLLLSLELKYQFIVVACASSLLSAVAVYYTQRVSRKSAIRKIKQEFKTTDDWDAETHFPNPNKTAETALISEQLSRNIAFLGEERVDKIRNSFVIVVGLGGVGSHAAHMLLRSGVEHIRLIDFDQVTLSSLNRHAVATRADVGVPKVVAVKNHLLQTVPHARIETCVEMFDGQGASRLLSGDPAFVLGTLSLNQIVSITWKAKLH